MPKNSHEMPDEQGIAVKSDDQAQLPADPQLAGRQEERAQSMTQSAAPTLKTAEWSIAEHESWREKLAELRDFRDSEARVCAAFVLTKEWELAAAAAASFAKVRDELREHLGLLPPSDEKKAN